MILKSAENKIIKCRLLEDILAPPWTGKPEITGSFTLKDLLWMCFSENNNVNVNEEKTTSGLFVFLSTDENKTNAMTTS